MFKTHVYVLDNPSSGKKVFFFVMWKKQNGIWRKKITINPLEYQQNLMSRIKSINRRYFSENYRFDTDSLVPILEGYPLGEASEIQRKSYLTQMERKAIAIWGDLFLQFYDTEES